MTYLQAANFPIRELVTDSRQVRPGDTFVAYPGEFVDGRRFIGDALERGASSVLFDAEHYTWPAELASVPHLAIPHLRWVLGEVAAEFYCDPSSTQWVCGVTGTNGKTSCTQWLAQILEHYRRPCAVIGTVGNGFIGRLEPSTHTTPDALKMQQLLAHFRGEGATHVAMEVSSHGLHQGRVNGVKFDCAVMTNLTRDHLDYHGSMEAYAEAKARLFEWHGLGTAVLNADDAFTTSLVAADRISAEQLLRYGFSWGAEIRASSLKLAANGFVLDLSTPWGPVTLETALLGRFNAYNLMAVTGAALAAGISLDQIAAMAPQIQPAVGRMQTLGGLGQPLVVIDYAHTPDALDKVLTTLREMLPVDHRLVAVFGCGGERDPGKRPMMGEVVSRLADDVVITSDNPRHEDPLAIIRDIEAGMTRAYRVEADRAVAIRLAIANARPGDIVLIAGKGHEDYQDIDGVKLPFSDAQIANEALQ